ncbi:MAG: FapA family protein [Hydrogenimonas sp.]|nr:FapA family protein [Hydrogenimonas sp.]
MGFFDKVFGSDKSDDDKREASDKKSSFTPFVTTTDNVAQTLHDTALKYKISSQSLDIRLLSVKTLIKMDPKEEEWIEIEDGEWEKFNKPEILLNPDFQIKQNYEIEILPYKEEPWKSDLLLHIASNKEKNRVVCTIKSGSIIRKSQNLKQKIKSLITAKMVRSRILTGLWDVNYDSAIDEIIAKALVQDQYILPEDATFDICVCFASQKPVNDELLLHYKLKNEEEQGDRVDYSKRGFIQAVEKGEAVIEYIKPQPGKPGRNCQGTFIPVGEPLEKFKPEFRVSEAIEIEEDEKRILYRAKKGGYVVFKDNTYDIQDSMEIDEVSFKKTGSIDAGVETEVKLHVSESDHMKDAIGTGVEVEATEVKVEGNVGASAVVVAEEVVIGGQTHQSSQIVAKTAKINVHRGFLKVSEEATISRLEGGEVEAKSARVSQAIGGEVKAIDIDVEVIASNVKLFAVSKIVIGKMLGENNKLVIDPSKIEAYHNEIVELEEKIVQIEKELSKLEELHNQKKSTIEKSETAVNTLKKRILEAKRKGQKPQPAFLAKIKQYQKLLDETSDIAAEIAKAQRSLQEVKRKLLAYQEMVINSKIVNYGEWKDYTDIEFHLLYPQKTLQHTPKAGESNQLIYLKRVESEDSDEVDYEIGVKEAVKE